MTKLSIKEVAQQTLSTILNDTVPFTDFLQGRGLPLYERLADPSLDLHSKLDEIIKLSCGLTLDSSPADNGAKRTQEQWFTEYWNSITNGTVMASMGDLYQNFKNLKKASEQGTSEQKKLAQTLVASLRNDFDWYGKSSWLMSSTRVQYAGNKSLDGEIIHHYNRPDATKRASLTIPVYRDAPLTKVVSDKNGLRYVRVLFDTDDGAAEMIETLKFVGDRTDIRIWTAVTRGEYNRGNYPSWSAGFYDRINIFHVNGGSVVDQGCSRGCF